MSQEPDHLHLFDKPHNVRRLLRCLYSLCALLLAADIVLQRHAEHTLEAIPVFYPVFGFVACVTLVLVAKRMRTLLKRPEDYYEGGPDAPD